MRLFTAGCGPATRVARQALGCPFFLRSHDSHTLNIPWSVGVMPTTELNQQPARGWFEPISLQYHPHVTEKAQAWRKVTPQIVDHPKFYSNEFYSKRATESLMLTEDVQMSQLARLVCFGRNLNLNRTMAMVVVRLGLQLCAAVLVSLFVKLIQKL